MSSKLLVPIYTQEKANTCGLAALRMILGYFGDDVSESELQKEVKLHSFGTYSTKLAEIAIKRGLKAKSLNFHLSIFAPLSLSYGTEITTQLLKMIKPKPSDLVTYETIKSYLMSEGKMTYLPPNIHVIEKLIDDKIPALISVNTAALGSYYKNWQNGHYLVVNGYSSDSFSVLDPAREIKTREYEIDKNILLDAWVINSTRSSDYLMSFSR